MKPFSFSPLWGIDNASVYDEDLQIGGKFPRLYVRDAVNINISNGRASMRPGLRKVCDGVLDSLWQSPLHGDTFAREGAQWVKVRTSDWMREPLATVGDGPIVHLVLNNTVLAACKDGLFEYDGSAALPLGIDTPAAPLVRVVEGGALEPGVYGVGVSWLRNGKESAVSLMAQVTAQAGDALEITLPLSLDASVTHARLYLTSANGGTLGWVEDVPIDALQHHIPLLPKLGALPPFAHMVPMPTGAHAGLWRGRLVTANANVLRFSQPMAYHVHDLRHDFVLLPQRITFLQPVDGGLWVGQVDHVVFLSGGEPAALNVNRKAAQPPVPFSSVQLSAEMAGELAGAGAGAVAWLAANGFVLGTADGQLMEVQAKRIEGIAGKRATCIGLGNRLTAAVI